MPLRMRKVKKPRFYVRKIFGSQKNQRLYEYDAVGNSKRRKNLIANPSATPSWHSLDAQAAVGPSLRSKLRMRPYIDAI